MTPETLAALEAFGGPYEAIDVTQDDEAYFHLLSELWAAGETFAVVEQDIVIGSDTLASFDRCPQPWCCAPYPYLGNLTSGYHGLGCVRFRAELIRATPDLFDWVEKQFNDKHEPRHWCTLDAWVHKVMAARYSRRPCGRHEKVGHLDPTSSHGCC
jgi:hypothetical protein